MRPPLVVPVLVLVLLLPTAPLLGQNFTGTFSASNQQGGTVTVTLQQGAYGEITGSMTGNGVNFQIEGMVEEGTAMGVVSSAQGGVFFEATLQGNQLTMVLVDVGPGNMPDYSTAQTILLSRSGGAGRQPQPPSGGGNPLAGGGTDPLAGDYSGDGIQIALQGSGGSYSGTMTYQGVAYPLSASGSGNRLSGSFTVQGQQYPFSASVQGQSMTLESGGVSYNLVRQGDAPSPSNPLAGGGGARPSGEAGSLMGRWRCQAPDGPALLDVLSNSELAYNGQRTTYQLGQGVMRVQEEWGVADYRFRIEGDRMSVTNPDRSVTQCQRQQGAQGGMEGLLQGGRCAYSSSPDGGFATTYRMYFDGQGNFLWGTESSFSGDPGMAYGLHNNPDAGRYVVGGTSRGSEIYLTWPNGDPGVATISLGDASGIYEFTLNGRHFAAALCGY